MTSPWSSFVVSARLGDLSAQYRPLPWLPGRHIQTIVPSLWPAPEVPGGCEPHTVDVGQGSAVRVDVNRPTELRRGTLLLIHGMCGSAESSYMRRTAAQALARGWVTARMNLRNCGGTERLARTLYNGGQSDDVEAVLAWLAAQDFPRPLAAIGFSLGGNILMRYLGKSAAACRAVAAAAVNPPVDLDRCSRAIERPGNRLYQRQYVWRLRAQLRRIREIRQTPAGTSPAREIRSVRDFDECFTAPDAGYAGAADYYAAASAAPWLAGNTTPALVLSAINDPFVPVDMFRPHHGLRSLRFVHPDRGGHCGYWQKGRPRYWAGEVALDFFDAHGSSRRSGTFS